MSIPDRPPQQPIEQPSAVVLLMYAARALTIAILGSFCRNADAIMRGKCTAEEAHRYPSGYPAQLDFGIYWYAKDGTFDKAYPGRRSDLYDPKRKTMVFIHGWSGNQGGATASCYRPSTTCDEDVCPDQRPTMDAWFDAGWNVGFFYWDQFADEPCARDAEQKVWFHSAVDEDDGFRWAQYRLGEDGRQFQMYKTKAKSVGELCADSISETMADFDGPELRFVGHSLGTQLATHCAALLHERNDTLQALKPSRLVLLDPFFTERHLHGMFRCDKPDLTPFSGGVGSLTLKKAARKIEMLYGRGVPTEVSLSSPFPESQYLGSPILPFEPLVVLVKREPTWCGSMMSVDALDHIGCRHKAAVILYFLSGANSRDRASSDFCDPSYPLECTDDELWELQHLQQSLADEGFQQYWEQHAGTDTRRTADDQYARMETRLGDAGLGGVNDYRRFEHLRKRPVSNSSATDDNAINRVSGRMVKRSMSDAYEQARCSVHYPFAYHSGDWCCRAQQEDVYAGLGVACDGGALSLESMCCKGGAFTSCSSPPCADYPVQKSDPFDHLVIEDQEERVNLRSAAGQTNNPTRLVLACGFIVIGCSAVIYWVRNLEGRSAQKRPQYDWISY